MFPLVAFCALALTGARVAQNTDPPLVVADPATYAARHATGIFAPRWSKTPIPLVVADLVTAYWLNEPQALKEEFAPRWRKPTRRVWPTLFCPAVGRRHGTVSAFKSVCRATL